MRFPQVVMGGMYDDYIRDREAFKERFRPQPVSTSPAPPPASAPSAAGVDLANKLCAIFQAWSEEMASGKPSVDALTEYQKAFNESMEKASAAERASAPALLRILCPFRASMFNDFNVRFRSQQPYRGRVIPLPPAEDTRPAVPTVGPFGLPTQPPPVSSRPPQAPQGPQGPQVPPGMTPTLDPFRKLPPATVVRPSPATGPVSLNPSTDLFWDGRQYRSSVASLPSWSSSLFSMTGAHVPMSKAPMETAFRVAGALEHGVRMHRARF